jgi:hypothetical protein
MVKSVIVMESVSRPLMTEANGQESADAMMDGLGSFAMSCTQWLHKQHQGHRHHTSHQKMRYLRVPWIPRLVGTSFSAQRDTQKVDRMQIREALSQVLVMVHSPKLAATSHPKLGCVERIIWLVSTQSTRLVVDSMPLDASTQSLTQRYRQVNTLG